MGMLKKDGRKRVVISGVEPEIDGGRYPAKRVVGDEVTVRADLFADGHDQVAGALLYRTERNPKWTRVPLTPLGNDRWEARFTVDRLGRYRFTVEGWIDRFGTWRRDLEKRVEAGQDVGVDLEIGAGLVAATADRARGDDADHLEEIAAELGGKGEAAARVELALGAELSTLMARWPDLSDAVRYVRSVPLQVDRELAGFSAWYELFPRSTSPVEGRHGTFEDLAERLPYVASMGFDIVYLPPIHPIGTAFRKGKNNVVGAEPDDVGSPWAIGAAEGGHTAIHPDLGTLEEFRTVLERADELGMEVALDLAFQCSPDHPYPNEHPDWFRARPDGTIQYAENPPKKYQDIYPFDFETEDWEGLWRELLGVIRFWIDQGVRIFRVDNPHTKPFRFWEWLIDEVRGDNPEVILLAEAFTRPNVMYHLAKIGFSQSYTYFTWRNTAREFEEYLTELTTTEPREFFRPNFWPNTPDILAEQLRGGERAAFVSRLILAATLSSNYGIYGPAFELMEHVPVKPGSEEYLDSEKYQLRRWDLEREDSLASLIGAVNRIRRDSPALHANRNLVFHRVSNEALLCYSKTDDAGENTILVVVSMDTSNVHAGWIELDLGALGLGEDASFEVHDLLSDARYQWHGARNYVELRPSEMPAHIFCVGDRSRCERDFEYFA